MALKALKTTDIGTEITENGTEMALKIDKFPLVGSKKHVKITPNLKKVPLMLDKSQKGATYIRVSLNLATKSDSAAQNKWKGHLKRVSSAIRTASNSKRHQMWMFLLENFT